MFEKPSSNPTEALKAELSSLEMERERLTKAIEEMGENVATVPFESPERRDFGFTEQLTEVEERIRAIETALTEADDAAAGQRNLHL